MTQPAPDTIESIAQLRVALDDANYRYYVLDEPHLTDAEYDRTLHQVQEQEQDFPVRVTPDSPARQVGDPPQERVPVVEHAVPMLSLDTALDEEEVKPLVRRGGDRLEHDGESLRF